MNAFTKAPQCGRSHLVACIGRRYLNEWFMVYTLLGYFGMNSIMEGRRAMASQNFYRIDSDYPKNRCSRSFANLGSSLDGMTNFHEFV